MTEGDKSGLHEKAGPATAGVVQLLGASLMDRLSPENLNRKARAERGRGTGRF